MGETQPLGYIEPKVVDPPRAWSAILQQLGPGLIITASIVGSGELIVTTKLGADVGFVLLWFILIGCIIKVFVQIELGRYAIAYGRTTIEAMNDVPGPRLKLGWMVYVWLGMYIATFFQLAGIIGTIADVFLLGLGTAPSLEGQFDWSQLWRAAAVALSCAVLLAMGRYSLIEGVSASMVALFTLFTVMSVGALYWTDYAITWDNLAQGMQFQIPDDFTIAFAAFGIIGVGASELIYYPYWCLEKGYARNAGVNDGSEEWAERARGWLRVLKTDAWVSMIIYTGATVAFYLLGAAVLHDRRVEVTDETLVPSLSQMYQASFGKPGLWFFLIGSFVVLFSTVFIATASNGRLLADLLRVLKLIRVESIAQRDQVNRVIGALLPIVYLALYLLVEKPLSLVLVGAVAQALMLPLLCIAAVYFHHRRMVPQLKTSWLWTILLWLACLAMAVAGLNQLRDEAGKLKQRFAPVDVESRAIDQMELRSIPKRQYL